MVGTRLPKWIWFIGAPPVLVGLAVSLWDAQAAPRRLEVPAAPARERGREPVTPAATLPKATRRPVGPAKPVASAGVSVDVANVEPHVTVPGGDPARYGGMATRWAHESRDGRWTRLFETDLRSALSAAQVPADTLQDVDCRQTLCRLVVEPGPNALTVQQTLAEQGRSLEYDTEPFDGRLRYVALVDRLDSD